MANRPRDNSGDAAQAVFANAAARAELADWLNVLADPAAHEGDSVVRVKENPSRTVWRCRLGEGVYYVKQYHRRDVLRRLRDALVGNDAVRELRFSRLLEQAGVPAIEVLATGRGRQGAWMVSRSVEAVSSARDWYCQCIESTNPAVRAAARPAIRQMAELVAHMHQAGILHRDLHMGNVLAVPAGDGVKLVFTDLHRMSHRRRLSRRACAANLAWLLHDCAPLTTRTDRLAFLKRYLAVRRCGGSLRGWQVLVEHFADRWGRKLHRSRDRRVYGLNKYFAPLRLDEGWRGHVLLTSRRHARSSAAATVSFTADQWRQALHEPERLFSAADAVVIKDSPSSQVVRRSLTVGQHTVDVYIKRSRPKRRRRLVLDAFRPSRSRRAFALGHALLERRIATALPLAALERRVGPFLRDNILITEAVAPADHLNDFLHRWLGGHAGARMAINVARQQQLARQLLCQLGRLLRRMQQEGFSHRDMKASNLLVHWTQEAPPELVMIDLDGLRRQRRVSTRRMFQALMRLNVSLLESPAVNHAGRLRMLMGYLRHPGCGRIEFKPYWRELEAWSARKLKNQINSRRKRQKRMRK